MIKRSFSRTISNIPAMSQITAIKPEVGSSESILFEVKGDRFFHVDLSKAIDSGMLTCLLNDLLNSDLTEKDLSNASRKVRNILSFSKMVRSNAQMTQLLYEASLVLSAILLLQGKVGESIEMLHSANDYIGSSEPFTPAASVQELIDRLVNRCTI